MANLLTNLPSRENRPRWQPWRTLALATAASSLIACTTPAPAPAPIPEHQARISFSTQPMDNLRAHRLNGELVRSLRFDDLPAGEHVLEVRFRFERPGGGKPGLREPQHRTCDLRIHYAGFKGGEQYAIRAELFNWRPRGWLQDAEGTRLSTADLIRCSPG
ncbi:MAG: hypothetical protein M1440_12375 [Gammaproteobacteria bacterium]|nr:hypothetical protein [Gammaproteobacteria bacterium]